MDRFGYDLGQKLKAAGDKGPTPVSMIRIDVQSVFFVHLSV